MPDPAERMRREAARQERKAAREAARQERKAKLETARQERKADLEAAGRKRERLAEERKSRIRHRLSKLNNRLRQMRGHMEREVQGEERRPGNRQTPMENQLEKWRSGCAKRSKTWRNSLNAGCSAGLF